MVSFLYLKLLLVIVIDLSVSFLSCNAVGECSLLLAVPVFCLGRGKKIEEYVFLCLYF